MIPNHLIFKVLKKVREAVEGTKIEQYAKLPAYVGELIWTNLMSSVELLVNKMPPELLPIFYKFYVCLEPCKRGFIEGCRPLIGLDGCFLKGYYKGELLVPMAQDGNNGFYVITYAIVESEMKESWRWFLTMLIRDIGDAKEHGWNFISNQLKVNQLLFQLSL